MFSVGARSCCLLVRARGLLVRACFLLVVLLLVRARVFCWCVLVFSAGVCLWFLLVRARVLCVGVRGGLCVKFAYGIQYVVTRTRTCSAMQLFFS